MALWQKSVDTPVRGGGSMKTVNQHCDDCTSDLSKAQLVTSSQAYSGVQRSLGTFPLTKLFAVIV